MAANFGTGYFADRPTGAQLFDMVVSGAGGIVDQQPGPGTQRYPAADGKVQIMFQILFQQPAVGIILIPAGKLPGPPPWNCGKFYPSSVTCLPLGAAYGKGGAPRAPQPPAAYSPVIL